MVEWQTALWFVRNLSKVEGSDEDETEVGNTVEQDMEKQNPDWRPWKEQREKVVDDALDEIRKSGPIIIHSGHNADVNATEDDKEGMETLCLALLLDKEDKSRQDKDKALRKANW